MNNKENNGLKSQKDELQIRLRPIWQGRQFCKSTFEENVICDVEEIRQLYYHRISSKSHSSSRLMRLTLILPIKH